MGKRVWLGTARESNEMLIGTREGVTRCYAVKRMIEEEKWSAEEIRELKGTPQRPNPQKVGLNVPTRMPVGEPPSGSADGAAAGGDEGEVPPATAPMPDPLVRRTPITHKEIGKYGTTPGCEACEAKMRGEVSRRGHTERCRSRIEEAMRADAQDKRKLEKQTRE